MHEGENIACMGGTSKAYTVAQEVDDGSEASVNSGVPLNETPMPRGNFCPPQANHE
jgi:predicted metalloendopeptidase